MNTAIKALEWADQVVDKSADVERIKGVLDFVKDEQETLVEFTGDLL